MTGRIALITGAAGAIGLATATLLAARGATIAAPDRAGTDLAPLQAVIPDAGRFLTLVADVTDGLTRAAAVEWGARGIRVNCINPGPIRSRTVASIEMGQSPETAAAVQAAIADAISMKRYGTPTEVAGLVAFLASDDAGYVNGGAFAVDGGMTAA